MASKTKRPYNDQAVGKTSGIALRYGNGCKQHPNCFTCPFPDCRFYINGHNSQPMNHGYLQQFLGEIDLPL